MIIVMITSEVTRAGFASGNLLQVQARVGRKVVQEGALRGFIDWQLEVGTQLRCVAGELAVVGASIFLRGVEHRADIRVNRGDSLTRQPEHVNRVVVLV